MGPAKLMNETAVHTRLLPRISQTGRRWMSIRADIRSPICTAPDSTMPLFCPVLRSLHFFPAMAVPPRSRVRLQSYGAVGKVSWAAWGIWLIKITQSFSLRGAHRSIVAYGCSRLRSDLRWRRPCGHVAPARALSGCVSTATKVVPGRGPDLDGPIVWAELFTAVSRAPGYRARSPNSLALARASSWEWAPRLCRRARMWLRTVACER